MTVSAAPNPSTFGESVILSASLSTNSQVYSTPFGLVTFTDETGAVLGTSEVVNSTAELEVSSLTAASHTITAEFSSTTTLADLGVGGLSYDASAQFSATANPSGPWSYGHIDPDGAFALNTNPFTAQGIQFGTGAPSNIFFWGTDAPGGALVSYNPSDELVGNPNPSLRPGFWDLHSLGLAPVRNGGAAAVLRFTAPGAGRYQTNIEMGGASASAALESCATTASSWTHSRS